MFYTTIPPAVCTADTKNRDAKAKSSRLKTPATGEEEQKENERRRRRRYAFPLGRRNVDVSIVTRSNFARLARFAQVARKEFRVEPGKISVRTRPTATAPRLYDGSDELACIRSFARSFRTRTYVRKFSRTLVERCTSAPRSFQQAHICDRVVRCLCKSGSFLLGQNRFHLVVSCLRSRSNAVALRWKEEHEESRRARRRRRRKKRRWRRSRDAQKEETSRRARARVLELSCSRIIVDIQKPSLSTLSFLSPGRGSNKLRNVRIATHKLGALAARVFPAPRRARFLLAADRYWDYSTSVPLCPPHEIANRSCTVYISREMYYRYCRTKHDTARLLEINS